MFQASPIRFSTCNLHGNQVKAGMTGVLPCVRVKQLVAASNHFSHTSGGGGSNTNTTGSSRSQHARYLPCALLLLLNLAYPLAKYV